MNDEYQVRRKPMNEERQGMNHKFAGTLNQTDRFDSDELVRVANLVEIVDQKNADQLAISLHIITVVDVIWHLTQSATIACDNCFSIYTRSHSGEYHIIP